MSDSSQGSGTPPVKPAPPKGAAAAPRAPAVPGNRPKPPAAPNAPIRPRAASVPDAVPEARRAREPLPEDATVPNHRHPSPSMPADDSWDSSPPKEHTEAAAAPVSPGSPSPPAVSSGAGGSGAVVTDASALKNALEEVLGPMQKALDDLTVKIARERVDRKDAIERLEKVLQRVQTAPPPNVAPAASPAPPPVAPVAHSQAHAPPPAQPFSVSPSSRPPPVAPVAAAPKAPSPVPPPVAAAPSPSEPPVAIPISSAPPAIYRPSSVPPGELEGPSDLAVIEGPRRIEVASYSTDLGIDLPPGLDGSRNKRRMVWIVAILLVGGALAMIISMIISRSHGPGAM